MVDTEIMELRRRQFSCPEVVEEINFNLGIVPWVFAVMSEFGVRDALDSRLLNTNTPSQAQPSEVVMLLVARYIVLGFKEGLYDIPSFAQWFPLNALYKRNDIELNASFFTSPAIEQALDAIASYGSTTLSAEVFGEIMRNADLNEQVETIRCEAKTKTIYTIPFATELHDAFDKAQCFKVRAEAFDIDKEDILPLQYQSGEGNFVQLQVSICNFNSSTTDTAVSLPLVSSAHTGNKADVTQMRLILEQSLEALAKSYPNLKYVEGDISLASSKIINKLDTLGLSLVGRLSNVSVKKVVEKAAKDELPFEEVFLNDEVYKVAWAGIHSFRDPEDKDKKLYSKMLVVCSDTLCNKKRTTIERKVEKEASELQKLVERQNKQGFTSIADAQKSAEDLLAKQGLTYHTSIIKISERDKQGKAKAKAAAKASVASTFTYSIELNRNEAAIEQAIKKESMYVLFTTNCDESDAASLVKGYQDNPELESGWKDINSTGLFVDSIFVNSNHRRNALIFVGSLAQFIAKSMLKRVNDFIAATGLKMAITPTYQTSRPTLTALNEVFSLADLRLSVNTVNKTFSVKNRMKNNFVYNLILFLDGESLSFYTEYHYGEYMGYLFNQG